MNIAIISIVLKDYIKPYLEYFEGQTSEEQFCQLYNMASDENNEEILVMLDYIERNDLKRTFFGGYEGQPDTMERP